MGSEADNVPKRFLARLIRSPVAIIGALGSLFVVLANAEGALDGATHLWHRWTAPASQLESTWQGDWTSRDGYHYGFAMQLTATETGDADGQISWQLKATPQGSHLEKRIGAVGVEFVKGSFDRTKGLASIAGYKVSDPNLLALDSYRFQIKPDQVSFVGMTKHRGEWEAQASGTVIVSEKK